MPSPPRTTSQAIATSEGHCHTKSAGINESGVRNSMRYVTIAVGDSVRARNFTVTTFMPPVMAENTIRSA